MLITIKKHRNGSNTASSTAAAPERLCSVARKGVAIGGPHSGTGNTVGGNIPSLDRKFRVRKKKRKIEALYFCPISATAQLSLLVKHNSVSGRILVI
jgi:hypothetical protein